MTLNEARNICSILKESFDSHDFISEYIFRFPSSYGDLLIKHNNVTTAHAEIANFLRLNSAQLHIRKTGEIESEDIFRHPVPCASWEKI